MSENGTLTPKWSAAMTWHRSGMHVNEVRHEVYYGTKILPTNLARPYFGRGKGGAGYFQNKVIITNCKRNTLIATHVQFAM